MKIRVLGCSGGISQNLATTSFLVDEDILIDAGTGVCALSLDEMRAIKHIFITHSHLDHIAAIPLLADTLFDDLIEACGIAGDTDGHAGEGRIAALGNDEGVDVETAA